MKLSIGHIALIEKITGYSQTSIHKVLNGESSSIRMNKDVLLVANQLESNQQKIVKKLLKEQFERDLMYVNNLTDIVNIRDRFPELFEKRFETDKIELVAKKMRIKV